MHAGPNIDTISDAYTCQGEVVSDGVLGRDLPERPGYLEGRVEIGLSAGGHAEGQTDPVHVYVHGNDEFRGGDPFPSTRVHGIFPHHPSQEEVQPLAGALSFRAGQKAVLGSEHVNPECPHEELQRPRDVGFSFAVGMEKTLMERSVEGYDLPGRKEEINQILAAREPVPESAESFPKILSGCPLKNLTG